MKLMKTILLFSFFFSVSFSLLAQFEIVGIDNAEKAARHFLEKQTRNNSYSIISRREIISGKNVLCYVFDLVPDGFVLVSSNTSLPPVIAFSRESRFGEMDNTNPLYSMAKANLTQKSNYNNLYSQKYIAQWNNLSGSSKSLDTTFQQWPATGDGWLTSNWTQNAPYSNFCPIDPVTSQRSIAGCPSIAMGQILNFHKTTNNTHFDDNDDYYHNYAGRQYWIDNDYIARGFPSFSQLNSYLDTLNEHYTNDIPLTNNDKAALTFACGVAATQVYTSSGSGTFGVNQAYEAYQRFNFTTASLLDTTNSDLFPRLIQNIKDTLPAHLAIVNQTSTSGHNVVVDGYNTDNYFHLNFGWGGSYNGWYLIPQEIPYSLTYIEGVVLDIMRIPTSVSEAKTTNTDVSVFPNPFNESTVIAYSLKNKTGTRLDIYDLTGKIIFSHIIDSEESGCHEISITLNLYPEGIYMYRFVADNKLYTGKLIKQKAR